MRRKNERDLITGDRDSKGGLGGGRRYLPRRHHVRAEAGPAVTWREAAGWLQRAGELGPFTVPTNLRWLYVSVWMRSSMLKMHVRPKAIHTEMKHLFVTLAHTDFSLLRPSRPLKSNIKFGI